MELFGLPLSLVLGGLLVVVGLGVVGFGDLLKFSPGRVWAIGGVVFSEGLRRRVWLVPPLVMLATVLLTQIGDPSDESDAIRQAIQFCLLASGLVAVLVTLVLACTNLPREVESRVIFTVVTKPVSRLELYVGKLVGFARLSALLLLVMGVFSYALLLWMNHALVSGIQERLAGTLVQEPRRPYLEHLTQTGLLQARRVSLGDDLQVYAEPPEAEAESGTAPRWFYPSEYYAAVPFRFPADVLDRYLGGDAAVRLAVQMRLPWRQMEQRPVLPGDPPLGIINLATLPPAPPPTVSVQVLDGGLFNVIGPSSIVGNTAHLPADPDAPWEQAATIRLDAEQALAVLRTAANAPDAPVYVAVYGTGEQYLYGVTPGSVRLVLEANDGNGFQPAETLDPAVGDDPRADLLVRTYLGQGGLGLAGPTSDLPPPTGVLAFRDTPPASPGPGGRVGFDLVLRVDPSGDVLDQSEDPRIGVRVYNLKTGQLSDEIIAPVSSGQEGFVSFPPQSVEGGDFDLRIQSLTRGQIVTARGGAIRLVLDDTPFVWNLAKALFAQWLLTVLVAAAGLTFSTFVGWPIAVTMTVVLLSGRWVGQQLGAALGTTGRQVAIDVFGAGGDANAKEALRAGVDALSELFNTVTAFLPDVGVYGLGDRVERGLALPLADVGTALLVTVAFVLPLTALAYLVLRRKEVAP